MRISLSFWEEKTGNILVERYPEGKLPYDQ